MIPLIEHTEQPSRQRSASGKFVKGNHYAKRGGHARAAKLSQRRRRQIAKQGWQGLVNRRFAGDERAAKAWVGAVGAHAYDRRLFDIYGAIRPAFPHPGEPSEFRSRLYQLYLLAGAHLDVNFYSEAGEAKPNVAAWGALVVFVVWAFLMILSVQGA